MDITANPVQRPQAAQPAPTKGGAATQISSDFEVFLKMLTAQMQYQDPLNPIDSTDYATQLATFSGVEQAVQTNDLLRALSSELGVGGLSELADWVGKEVRSAGPVSFDGRPVALFPQTNTDAQTWEISVRNAEGDEVQRIPVAPGTDEVAWTGLEFGGSPAPTGSYSFTAIGRTNGQVITDAPVETYARVTEVRIENAQQVLVLEGNRKVAYDAVTAIREPRAG